MAVLMRFVLLLSLGCAIAGVSTSGTSSLQAQEKEKAPRKDDAKPKAKLADANGLSLELEVLSAFRRLNATPTQLKYMRTLAKGASQAERKRANAKISDAYHQALSDLVAAYLHGDDDKINSIHAEMERLRDEDPPELDDLIEITEAAREKAPDLVRQFTAPQVAIYIIQMEVQDPFEQLMIAMDDSQAISGDEWKELRDSHAKHIAWLIAGAELVKSNKVQAQITSILSTAHDMAPDDFKKSSAELEKTAHKIVGNADALVVLRNTFEYHMASLLSNPKLDAAVVEMLKRE